MQSMGGKALLVIITALGLIGLAVAAWLILREPAEDRLKEIGKMVLVIGGGLLGFAILDWLRHYWSRR